MPRAHDKSVSNDLSAEDGGSFRHLWLSPWTAWVGFRYLKSKKNSRFLSFVTGISMGGVALGVCAMIVVLSVMDGFETELKKRLMSSELHVLITPEPTIAGFDQSFVPLAAGQEVAAQIAAAVKAAGAQQVGFWPVVATETILKSGRKVTGAMIKGVDDERLKHLRTQLVESADPQMLVEKQGSDTVRLPGLLVGQEMAYEMALIPGDQVTLISPTQTEGPLGNIPRMKRFVVEGIYHSGTPEQELSLVYSPASAVRSFLKKADVLSSWELSLGQFEQAPQVAEQLRKALPGYHVQDWIQMNSHLFASLRLERVTMFIILAFIIIVASFNIVTTLTLMVLEKKREISILKAMGARSGQVAAIFLAEGIFIGVFGVGIGTVLAFLICGSLRRYEFIQLPEIYYDRTLPVSFDPLYYALVAGCALVIVLFACNYPSKRASRLNPLDGIRFG